MPGIKAQILAASARFDAALPMLKHMRDVAEHFDDYAMDSGRLTSVSRKSLEVGVVGDSTFQSLNHELNADVALTAAKQFFEEIQQVRSLIGGGRGIE